MTEQDPLMEEMGDIFEKIEADIVADDDPIQRYTRSMYKNASARAEAEARFKRDMDALKAGHADVIAELDRWKKGIDYKHGPAAWLALDRRLKTQKARFVPTHWGRLLKRKKAGRVVRRIREGHEDDLLAWAEKYYPDAITKKPNVDKDAVPVTCPHVYDEPIPEEDNFHYELPKAKEKIDGGTK